jgi:hypothetical protein
LSGARWTTRRGGSGGEAVHRVCVRHRGLGGGGGELPDPEPRTALDARVAALIATVFPERRD